MLDGREDFYSVYLFLILKFATRKITTIPACPQHLLLQTRPALPLSLACMSSAFWMPQCWLLAVTALCPCTRACKLQSLDEQRWGDRQRTPVASHSACHFTAGHDGQPTSSCISEVFSDRASSSRYRMPITGADLQCMFFCIPDSYSWEIFTIQNQKYCHKVWIKSSLFCLRANTVTGWYFPTLQLFYKHLLTE